MYIRGFEMWFGFLNIVLLEDNYNFLFRYCLWSFGYENNEIEVVIEIGWFVEF